MFLVWQELASTRPIVCSSADVGGLTFISLRFRLPLQTPPMRELMLEMTILSMSARLLALPEVLECRVPELDIGELRAEAVAGR